jgi:putative SOS response-associated peptidase YedK
MLLAMCNAYNLRHGAEAILDIARAMRVHAVPDLPPFPPRHRIGIRQRGLILRSDDGSRLEWSWARWSVIPPGRKEPPRYPLNNARSDKLDAWPWKALRNQRCLVPASGFWEAEKKAGASGSVPWRYYSMRDGKPFFIAGLWSNAPDPETGEIADGYTIVIDGANEAIHIHDRMPVILPPDGAAEWLSSGPLPTHLLKPYSAEAMTGWRVANDAKNSRIEPHESMSEPVAEP